MAEKKVPPKNNQRTPRSSSHNQKTSKSSPHQSGEDRTTEILFLILVGVAIFGAFANFARGPLTRSLFVQLFHPTSLSYYDYATGAGVYVSTAEGNVLDAPAGTQIGSQSAGARGTITDGPKIAVAGGIRFWDIDFVTGVDGWLDEKELLLFKPATIMSFIVNSVVTLFKFTSTILSLLFLAGIIYSLIRLSQLVAEYQKKEKHKESPAHAAVVLQDHQNRRWERVIAHVQSEAPGDWRLAILEADIILAELLDRMGYIGENIGEKLKAIEKSDFETIDDAWEAHKVRNQIAHQGSDYVLSRREAQRVISLYTNVFREFKYI